LSGIGYASTEAPLPTFFQRNDDVGAIEPPSKPWPIPLETLAEALSQVGEKMEKRMLKSGLKSAFKGLESGIHTPL